jgi:hypothetical protein
MNSSDYMSLREYETTNNDDNHLYANLGLSINRWTFLPFKNIKSLVHYDAFLVYSQELISQLYHSFNENDSYREKFEDILYSILDDIQRYKSENERLENAHKK